MVHKDSTAWTLIFGAWMVASTATLGALFFSEVMRIPPCVLCWYQRICMFPLVLLLPLGLFPLERKVARYGLALALAGLLVAAFHLLLMAGVVPENLKPCSQGVPCSEQTTVWLGFVSIPMLSLVAFSTIIGLLWVARERKST